MSRSWRQGPGTLFREVDLSSAVVAAKIFGEYLLDLHSHKNVNVPAAMVYSAKGLLARLVSSLEAEHCATHPRRRSSSLV